MPRQKGLRPFQKPDDGSIGSLIARLQVSPLQRVKEAADDAFQRFLTYPTVRNIIRYERAAEAHQLGANGVFRKKPKKARLQ